MKTIKIKLKQAPSLEVMAKIETEIGVLKGVKNVKINLENNECRIDFNEDEISEKEIVEILAKTEPSVRDSLPAQSSIREFTYFVKGMHCASCEVLIEKRLLKFKGVKSVEASTVKEEVLVEFEGQRPTREDLTRAFRDDGYTFFDRPIKDQNERQEGNLSNTLVTAGIIIFLFFLLNKMGLSSWVNVSSSSSLPAFFFLGLLAGLSSCAALVGGLVLSMSKQWLSLYHVKDSTTAKLQPHVMFGVGRLISYAFFGAILGGIGSRLQISPSVNALLVLVVSVLMFLLGLQMLGVKSLRKFQITMPKFITRRAADESKFQGKHMPFVLGAATFFLPCGFTITAQGLALLSGSAWQGGLIMLSFALGTVPMLLAIGLSSVKFSSRPHLANKFLKVAGAVVLFFALFNVNAQMNVLGFSSFSDALSGAKNGAAVNAVQIDDSDLPPVVAGKQVIKMDAGSTGYSPNYFKVKVGVPVRWEITDSGTSGCTNAILSRGLFDGQIQLTPGEVSVKEFTPTKAGKYKFSCWMGMISGTIEVVDRSGSSRSTGGGAETAAVVPSGAKGCGCGGGGSGGGSCAAPATN